MQPETSIRFDIKNILASLAMPIIFWAAAVVFMLIFRIYSVISLTPLAWALAILVGRTAARKSRSSTAAAKMIEAALSGALLGVALGLIFILVARFFAPGILERGAAITAYGAAVCALLAFLMGWKYARRQALPEKAASGPCPTCGREMLIDRRYLDAICPVCVEKASDENGRRLSFFNETISGGLKTYYAGTEELYRGMDCYVDGVRCRAREARMGGVVVEKFR